MGREQTGYDDHTMKDGHDRREERRRGREPQRSPKRPHTQTADRRDIVFGVEPVREMLAAEPAAVQTLYVRGRDQGRFAPEIARVRQAGGQVVAVEDLELVRMAGSESRHQGLVAAVQRPWATAHESEIVGYIRGYAAGLDWLYVPANKDEAIAILRKNIATMTPELAEQTYAVLLAPKGGLFKQAKLDVAGIKTVLALRSQYGQPKKTLTNPAKYYDLGYYKKAMAK